METENTLSRTALSMTTLTDAERAAYWDSIVAELMARIEKLEARAAAEDALWQEQARVAECAAF